MTACNERRRVWPGSCTCKDFCRRGQWPSMGSVLPCWRSACWASCEPEGACCPWRWAGRSRACNRSWSAVGRACCSRVQRIGSRRGDWPLVVECPCSVSPRHGIRSCKGRKKPYTSQAEGRRIWGICSTLRGPAESQRACWFLKERSSTGCTGGSRPVDWGQKTG